MVEFRGLAAWPEGIELVEVGAEGQVIDLHNEATLTAIEIVCLPLAELTLRFRKADGRAAALTFGAVTDLRFCQDRDDGAVPFVGTWDPEAVETFYGVEFTEMKNGGGRFEIGTIIGTFTFAARSVHFRHE